MADYENFREYDQFGEFSIKKNVLTSHETDPYFNRKQCEQTAGEKAIYLAENLPYSPVNNESAKDKALDATSPLAMLAVEIFAPETIAADIATAAAAETILTDSPDEKQIKTH